MKTALDLLHEDEARQALYGVRREKRSATSDLLTPQSWLLNHFGNALSKSGASVSETTACNVSIVRACISFRANLLAMLPVHLFRRTGRGPQRISPSEHPVARLLRRRVGPAQTSFQWRHVCSVNYDLGGTAYSRIYRAPTGEIEGIRWIKPCDIEPRINEQTGYVGYHFRKTGEMLTSDQVLKVANLSTNGYTGRSPLSDLRESVGLAITAEEYSARSFLQGNRMAGVFVGDHTVTKEKADEFLKFFFENYGGAVNSGKSPFLFGGIDWKQAGFSNHDAELLMTRKFSVEEIARVYHLPLHLVGSTEKSTTWGSGIEQLNQGLVDYTLAPLCRNWEAEMDTTLLTEQEQDEGYFIKFGVDALLRGSFETRSKIYETMRRIGAMDVNQIREIEDWELYPDSWAGDPRLPLNAQESGQKQPGQAQPNPAPGGAISE